MKTIKRILLAIAVATGVALICFACRNLHNQDTRNIVPDLSISTNSIDQAFRL